MAKSAPYPPCTVTAFWLKYQDPARMQRRVTQPPHIAGPLWLIGGPMVKDFNELGKCIFNFFVIDNNIWDSELYFLGLMYFLRSFT